MYNFLKQSRNMCNSVGCRFETYSILQSTFGINGDVEGWDIYTNIALYGVWDSILFGTALDTFCYIGRSDGVVPFKAADFYIFNVKLKWEDKNIERSVPGISKAKLMWQRIQDTTWSEECSFEFNIDASRDTWHNYMLDLREKITWQDDIKDIRFYIGLDVKLYDIFYISHISFDSNDVSLCTNRNCSYYVNYTKNCLGAGKEGYIEGFSTDAYFNLITDYSDFLYINIDNYGIEKIELGTLSNISGKELAVLIENALALVGVGSYAYSQVIYTESSTFKIISGTLGKDSVVTILYSKCAELLGFYDGAFNFIGISEQGLDIVDGFEYKATVLLDTNTKNKLRDNDAFRDAYTHKPDNYSVEIGRADFVNTFTTLSDVSTFKNLTELYNINSIGRTIVDITHVATANGRMHIFRFSGYAYEGAALKVLRPRNDGSYKVVYSKLITPNLAEDKLYSKNLNLIKVDCNFMLCKGDVIGLYNVTILASLNSDLAIDATYFYAEGEIIDTVIPTEVHSTGLSGLAFYGHSKYKAVDLSLDIFFDKPLDISNIFVVGNIEDSFYEYNVAICKDLSFDVDLFEETHFHRWTTCDGVYTQWVEHKNMYFGKDALSDGQVFLDSGLLGIDYVNVGLGTSTDGLETYGKHAYFYVNGDAEWLRGSYPDIAEFYVCPDKLIDYEEDPIAFDLYFPKDIQLPIHKIAIYFKESNNFKNFYLAYLHDLNYTNGSVLSDRRFSYIKDTTFETINVNDTTYFKGDDPNVDIYLWRNPVIKKLPSYEEHAQDIYLCSYLLYWNFLEYTFTPVECKGFRFFTDLHYSTKLFEIEIYTKSLYSSSLVEITSVLATNNDNSQESLNTAVYTKGLSATVTNNYKHFNLKFKSAHTFSLKEFLFNTKQQVTTDKSALSLNNVKKHFKSKELKLDFSNPYEVPADLNINLPKMLLNSSDLIFYSSLNSVDSILEPAYGPKPYLVKKSTFFIENQGMIAINLPTYGLVNLVDSSLLYISCDFVYWEFKGLLIHDVPLELPTKFYCDTTKIEGVFEPVSTNYFLIKTDDPNIVHLLRNFSLLYEDTLVDIDYIFVGTHIGREEIRLNSNTNFILGDYIYKYDFEGSSLSEWVVDLIGGATVTEEDSCVTFKTCANLMIYVDKPEPFFSMYKLFNIYGDLGVDFYLKYSVSDNRFRSSQYDISYNLEINYGDHIKVFLDSVVGSSDCTVKVTIYKDTTFLYTHYFSNFCLHTYNLITFVKVADTFIFSINNILLYKGVYPDTVFSKISFNNFKTNYDVFQADLFSIDYIYLFKPAILYKDTFVGFKLKEKAPTNKFIFIDALSDDASFLIYTSMDGSNYFLVEQPHLVVNSTTLLIALDLKQRYSLDIIRNYYCGDDSSELLFIDKYSNVIEYSNDDIDDINNVIFSSTYLDCRWLLLKIECLSTKATTISKLGIYSDIRYRLTPTGKFNTSWHYLGTFSTDYLLDTNVAYRCSTEQTSYYVDTFPVYNVVDNNINYDPSVLAGWIFEKPQESLVQPSLILTFDAVYDISRIEIYNGLYKDILLEGVLKINILVSTTLFGDDFTNVLSNFYLSTRNFYNNIVLLELFAARRLKIEVLDAKYIEVYYTDVTTNLNSLSFLTGLKEVKVYREVNTNLFIDSHKYPVICYYLRDSFQISAHSLEGLVNYAEWFNEEAFYAYSADSYEDPAKVSFYKKKDSILYFKFEGPLIDLYLCKKYKIEDSLYLNSGKYIVRWQALNTDIYKNQYLYFEGKYSQTINVLVVGSNWTDQISNFVLEEPGLYNIYIINEDADSHTDWGIQNLFLYSYIIQSYWVALTANTAECQSFNNDSSFKKDRALCKLYLFSLGTFNITEYWWWWKTLYSTTILTNDSLNVLKGSRSLVIKLGPNILFEEVLYNPGDSLGVDLNFSIFDFLCFDLKISGPEGLNTDKFYIYLEGLTEDKTVFWYKFRITPKDLKAGWNSVRLSFFEAVEKFPYNLGTYLNADLDLRKAFKLNTIKIQPYFKDSSIVTLWLDTFRIERNTCDNYIYNFKSLYLFEDEYLSIPLTKLSFSRGTIDFIVKLGTTSHGSDIFRNPQTVVFFTLSNNNNEYISLILKRGNWFAFEYGLLKEANLCYLERAPVNKFFNIGEDVAVSFTWDMSSAGVNNSGDNFELCLDGKRALSAKSYFKFSQDTNIYFKLGGGLRQAFSEGSLFTNLFFADLKIYNYSKSSLANALEVYKEANYYIDIREPNKQVVHNLSTGTLPLIYTQVPVSGVVSVYISVDKSRDFLYLDYTAALLIEWLISE